ncbi:hypothetical protein [Bacillus thuringiensis]|uniref:hypothetical protein n=1 Tax=Bacillus thuringiensis TaxID=1428 RepID=UPI003B982B25
MIKENEEFETDYVFVKNDGEQIDRNHFRKRLRKYVEETGIIKRVQSPPIPAYLYYDVFRGWWRYTSFADIAWVH